MTDKQDSVVVCSTPLFGGIAIAFGSLMIAIGVGTVFKPDPMALIVSAAELLGGGIAAAGGYYLMTHRKIHLRFSEEGLYVEEHRITVPWDAIERVEVVDLNQRKSMGQRIGEGALNLAVGGRAVRNPVFMLVVSFNGNGRQRFANRDFIGTAIRRALHVRDEESLLIRPFGLDWHSRTAPFKNLDDMAVAIQIRSDNSKNVA